MFAPGQTILYRGIHVTDSGVEPPVLADVKPAIVELDTPDLVALWVLAGTATKMARPIDPTQPKPWFSGQWELVDGVWSRWNALFLIEPDAWHATWVWWTPNWDFLGWYVNLQEPLVRCPDGFEHRDLQLDIVVRPDRSWRWKDEDDLTRSVETGVISVANAAGTREEAERLVARIERGEHPFVRDVATRRPDPAWRLRSVELV
jgi:predicted RNA-binding protein associated with RNAse of E/G family